MVATSLEEGGAIEGVERVFKVHFEQNLFLVTSAALELLARYANANFGALELSYSYLQREQQAYSQELTRTH